MTMLSVAFALPLLLAPVSVEPETLSIDTVLAKWCQASQSTSQFDAEFHSINSDATFQVERRKTGRFYFRAPRQGRIEFRPAALPNGGGNQSKFAPGKPAPETWIWTGDQLIVIDEASRTYRSTPVPNAADNSNSAANTPSGASILSVFRPFLKPQALLPLVVDLNEADLRRDFKFELTRSDSAEVRLSATPLTKEWKARYRAVDIILDREGFHVKAIRYVDPAGISASVIIFSAVKINQVPANEETLLHPDLEKLRYTNLDSPKSTATSKK